MSQYAVIDLEMCSVPRGEKRSDFGYATELIQIGAVLLNESYETIDTYMSYVRPEFGSIDPFIERLTGITRSDVEDAPTADAALADFLKWLPSDTKIVSWSDSDYYQIIAELDGKEIDLPKFDKYLDEWIDCQYTFGEKMGAPEKCYKLSEALIITDIDYGDGEHDALVDAKNTALLFRKMEQEDDLKLSPYLYTSE